VTQRAALLRHPLAIIGALMATASARGVRHSGDRDPRGMAQQPVRGPGCLCGHSRPLRHRAAVPNIWLFSPDGKRVRQLTHFADDRTITEFVWSSAGKRPAIARGTATNDIVLFKGLK
jgi:hypothetical protein